MTLQGHTGTFRFSFHLPTNLHGHSAFWHAHPLHRNKHDTSQRHSLFTSGVISPMPQTATAAMDEPVLPSHLLQSSDSSEMLGPWPSQATCVQRAGLGLPASTEHGGHIGGLHTRQSHQRLVHQCMHACNVQRCTAREMVTEAGSILERPMASMPTDTPGDLRLKQTPPPLRFPCMTSRGIT